MTPLLTLIPMPYRLVALAFLVVAVYGTGWVRGSSHEAAKRDAIELRMSVQIESLTNGVAEQNRAVRELAIAGQSRVDASRRAIQKASTRVNSLTADLQALHAYTRPVGMDQCEAAQAIVEADNASQ